jgi:hypothetical protein
MQKQVSFLRSPAYDLPPANELLGQAVPLGTPYGGQVSGSLFVLFCG